VYAQLIELKNFGLYEAASSIDFVFATNASSEAHRLLEAEAFTAKHLPRARVTTFERNQFEYQPLLKVWRLAKAISLKPEDHLILYFHSKGMMNKYGSSKTRTDFNIKLTDVVIKPWRDIVERFYRDKAVNRAGFATAGRGWIWFVALLFFLSVYACV